MAQDIDTAFVEEFEADVHLAYQRTGSKLRSTVRYKSNVANKTTFQKIGKGAATTKARHGDVVPMDLTHSVVDVTTEDWYAPDYVDDLDELRIFHDERDAVVKSGVYALGRKTDSQIVTQLATATNIQLDGSAAMTLAKATKAFENFGNRDVPEDEDRFGVVGYQQWVNLLGLAEFSSLDYVPANMLPYTAGMTAKQWLSFMWFAHSGLTLTGSNRECYVYHRSAMGYASGTDIKVDISWQGMKQAWLFVPKMQGNGLLIDQDGVEEILCVET